MAVGMTKAKSLHSCIAIGLLAGGLLLCPHVGLTDDFNEARLRSAQAAYQAKRFSEAIDQFRVAVFGYLDQPALLSECLARLALAQTAAGKTTDADETLNRFLEVERQFGVLAKANLDPETRAEFRALLTRRIPPATLTAVPSLSGLVETEETKLSELPPADRRKGLEAAAKREPGAVRWPLALSREAMERGDMKDAERWAGKALALDGSNADALALRARARVAQGEYTDAARDLAALPQVELDRRPDLYAEKFVCAVEAKDWEAASQVRKLVPAILAGRGDVTRAQQKLAAEEQRKTAQNSSAAPPKAARAGATAPAPIPKPPAPAPADAAAKSKAALAESRQLMSTGKTGDAEKLLTEALNGDPANRDLRLALLEAACLSRSYEKGVAQVQLVTPLADTEAPSMFYAAVALYETGHLAEARGYLERALPKVSGQLVDEYSKKILGR